MYSNDVFAEYIQQRTAVPLDVVRDEKLRNVAAAERRLQALGFKAMSDATWRDEVLSAIRDARGAIDAARK